jgi:glycosyltransferase involved in cell wall biosynthesis
VRLIINCSTLSGTGVTQVATSFILECIKFTANEYHVFLSRSVEAQIKDIDFPDNFFIYRFDDYPMYSLFGYSKRIKILNLESIIKPDCVFTVFGPSWIKFKSTSFFGYAYPHYIYPESPFFQFASLSFRFKVNVFYLIHKYFLKKDGNFFICETDDVSNRFSSFFGVPKEKVFTVGNTFNNYFNEFQSGNGQLLLPENRIGEYRFLCLFSFQLHKNFICIKNVIGYLRSHFSTYKVKFILTIATDAFDSFFSFQEKEYLINLGNIKVKDCPQLYSECYASFIPTLLECFSANYPESMKMGLPILTSDLSFSRSICKDAAIYFDPVNYKEICEAIILLISSPSVYDDLVKKGFMQLENFESANSRALKYLDLFSNHINS